ncbi:MAG: AI-2E family transporter [Streptosporangiales bacterium]|nr:AI-2E family transporter [Streptosporangiales bacterium]
MSTTSQPSDDGDPSERDSSAPPTPDDAPTQPSAQDPPAPDATTSASATAGSGPEHDAATGPTAGKAAPGDSATTGADDATGGGTAPRDARSAGSGAAPAERGTAGSGAKHGDTAGKAAPGDRATTGADDAVSGGTAPRDADAAGTTAYEAAPGDSATAGANAGNIEAAGQGTAAGGGEQEIPEYAAHVEVPRDEMTVSSRFPFGRPGRPFRRSPFLFGLTGALGVAVAWALVQAVINVQSVIVILIVAMFLAVGLNPAVEFLQRRKVPRGLAVTIVFVALLVFVAGFVSAIVPPLVQQSQELWANRNDYLATLQNNATINRLDERYQLLERAQDYLNTRGQALGSQLATGIVGAGKAIASGIFNTFSVLILTLYFLAALPKIKRTLYRLAPRTRRERVTLLGDEITQRVGGYVSGAAIVVFIAGLSTYIWLLIWRVPYALPLALCVMLLGLIPMIGATIGGVLVTLVSFSAGIPTGIATALFYVGYQQLENYLIYPRVMRKAVELPAAVTVVAILVGGSLLGVLGALLAIPSAAAVLLIFREVVVPRLERA